MAMTNPAARPHSADTTGANVPGRMARARGVAPMSDPTLTRLQGRRRRRGSSLVVSLLAAALVAAVGAAGLYALTRPHNSSTVWIATGAGGSGDGKSVADVR